MGNLTRENIEWAASALTEGRSLEFIASVLETTPRKAKSIIGAHTGRPLSRPRQAIAVDGPHVWRATESDTSEARKRAEALFDAVSDDENTENDDESPPFVWGRKPGPKPKQTLELDALRKELRAAKRRRFLLACRFGRHWDMIWFLTGQGMSGRSLRTIYGAKCLIWAKGGGVDDAISD